MRVVLTIVGKDKVGITAKVSNALAEMNINIINIKTLCKAFSIWC